jgi:peptide-methionine (S)-S-oxide reductase
MNDSCDIRGAGLAIAPNRFPDALQDITLPPTSSEQIAVLAGGCFWCVEAVFVELKGVLEVTSGYAGGTAETANYRAVCSGATNHAEVIRVRFDPARISYGQILKVFFSVAHDPTQLNRQGNDRGRQYRSAIFYADAAQKAVAEAYIRQLNEAGVFSAPIVTTIEPLDRFYEAEAYHQNYAAQHPDQPYIAYTAAPKVDKLRKYFGERLRSSASQQRDE